MNEHKVLSEDTLHIITELERAESLNQRQLSAKLNISLGKTNYIIKALVDKGLVKVADFAHNSDKAKKVRYLLTSKGLKEKMNLLYHFLIVKEKEYRRIKSEYKRSISVTRKN